MEEVIINPYRTDFIMLSLYISHHASSINRQTMMSKVTEEAMLQPNAHRNPTKALEYYNPHNPHSQAGIKQTKMEDS